MLSSEQPPDETSKPATAKRSLFNKPTWSKPVAENNPIDLFQRSSSRYAELVQEETLERSKKNAARIERERQRQSSAGGEREGKRRRISDSDQHDVNPADFRNSISGGRGTSSDTRSPRKLRAKPIQDACEATAEALESLPRQGNPRITKDAPILLSDDDEETVALPDHDPRASFSDNELGVVSETVPGDDDALPSDEEYPELVRKARERAQEKEAGREKSVPAATGNQHHDSQRQNTLTATPLVSLQSTRCQPSEPDHKVTTFITSNIPNTNALLAHVRLQQQLRDIRIAWCMKQRLDTETTASVFLTYKGVRLYDVSTCKSLGLGVDRSGILTRHGKRQSLTEEEQKVHLEIWTEDSWTEHMRERERSDRRGRANSADATGGPDCGGSQDNNGQIRILLKSKGYPDHKIVARPTTTALRMVEAFRGAMKIPPEKEIFLVFDGDKIEPGSTAGDADIGDMDNIDVHVK